MPTTQQTCKVLRTLVDMVEALVRFRKNMAQRYAFFERTLPLSASDADWNQAHSQMMEQFGAHALALEDVYGPGKFVQRWLEFHKTPALAAAFQKRLDELWGTAVDADMPTKERPSFVVRGIADLTARDFAGYLKDLGYMLKDDAESVQAMQPPNQSALTDLISTEVAISEYHTSRRTIARKIEAGALTDHRPANSPGNATYLLSREQLGRLFRRRK